MNGYLSIDYCISLISQPLREVCDRILADHRSAMERAQGSVHNHQAWSGGYIDHVTETMNLAHLLYPVLSECRVLPFTLSDALVALFFHDLEKAFPDQIEQLVKDGHYERPYAKWEVRWRIIHQYAAADMFSTAIINAIDFAEGEKDEYTNSSRKMGLLATFVHTCDVLSARLWFDRPWEHSEAWGGRIRKGVGECHACYKGIVNPEEVVREKDRVFHKACWEKTYPLQTAGQ